MSTRIAYDNKIVIQGTVIPLITQGVLDLGGVEKEFHPNLGLTPGIPLHKSLEVRTRRQWSLTDARINREDAILLRSLVRPTCSNFVVSIMIDRISCIGDALRFELREGEVHESKISAVYLSLYGSGKLVAI